MGGGSGLEAKGHWCRGNERGDAPAWLLSGPQVTPVAGEDAGRGFLYKSYILITGVNNGKTVLAALP